MVTRDRHERLIEYYLENKLLSAEQRKTLKEYDQHATLKGNTFSSRANNVKVLFFIGRDIKKPYKKITKKDIINFFSSYTIKAWQHGAKGTSLERFKDTGRKPARATLRTYIQTAEYFFRWFGKKDIADYLLSVRPLKNLEGRAKAKDVWSEEEIKKLIQAGRTLVRKTAIMVLYEMAGRVKEAQGLNLEDVKFNEDGTTELTIRESKTSEGRTTTRILYQSTPFLKEYIEQHPLKDNPEAPLFVTFHDQQYRGGKSIERLGYGGWHTILKYAHKGCGIKKKLYLHLLRVSRASNLIKAGVSLPIVQKIGAWKSVNSMRPYLKLSDTDVRKAIKEMNGVVTKEDKESKDVLKPKTCLKCDKVYSADKIYCSKCNLPLDPKKLFEQKQKEELKDKFLEILMDNKEVRTLALEKAKGSGSIRDLIREYNGLNKT